MRKCYTAGFSGQKFGGWREGKLSPEKNEKMRKITDQIFRGGKNEKMRKITDQIFRGGNPGDQI